MSKKLARSVRKPQENQSDSELIRREARKTLTDPKANNTAKMAAANMLNKLDNQADGVGLGDMSRAEIVAELEACRRALGRK